MSAEGFDHHLLHQVLKDCLQGEPRLLLGGHLDNVGQVTLSSDQEVVGQPSHHLPHVSHHQSWAAQVRLNRTADESPENKSYSET